MISRFIEITSKIIQFSKEGTDLSAAYIPTLLNFSAEPDTIDFFNNIFTNGSKATVYLQNVLLQQNFVNFLANAIGQVPYPTSLNDAAMTVIGIFTIITSATKSPVLNPQITNPNVVLHLLRDFPNAPCAVKDARWQTVLALCTPNNCNVFMNILDQAIRELSNLGPYFHSYQVSCVRLLLRVASVIPNVSSKLVQLNIALLLKNILDTYPTHTFAHIAVSEAFTDTINNPILGPHIFNLLPLVANTVPNRNVFLLSSISIKIMMDLQNKSNGNQQYSQIIEKYVPKNHPCWGIIEQFKQLLNSAYGGPIEDTKADLDK
ncbi:hypothetical protein GPJ56_005596 [Histomonas meleagridis]|uniref:uncharacterized protein n=1 Tax=Histomonas meleagridis TaxID=135588 RepID=UPI003559F14C|nr:hypothetical protein GPJ56_005596 [Histomonas meleagridis]KAH0797594.1 hypothetical protein GO595_009604 [Histomonas meleagridis]